jgi:hypothetical protein
MFLPLKELLSAGPNVDGSPGGKLSSWWTAKRKGSSVGHGPLSGSLVIPRIAPRLAIVSPTITLVVELK